MDADNAQTLRLAYQQAVELAQYKAGFLARAGHELRSPLNRLISLNQLILNDLCDSPEEQKSFIAEGYNAALELLALMDQIIAVAKFEVGRAIPKLGNRDLVDSLLELEMLVGLQVRDRGMALSVNAAYDAIPVWIDPTWLAKALTGLIEVAVEVAQGGSIRLNVTVREEQGNVELTLADDRSVEDWAALVQDLQTLDPDQLPAVDESIATDKSALSVPNLPKAVLSPALRVYIAQQTLRAMGIACDIVSDAVRPDAARSDKANSEPYRIRCLIPMPPAQP
ncbi:MAG: HAMP domain-containing sensor histidine kinase [Cyanobacteria bacterium P01_H01_bin.119]